MIDRVCEICSKDFRIYPYKLKEGRGRFCSKECFIKYSKGRQKTEEFKQKVSKGLTGLKRSKEFGEEISNFNNFNRK